MEFRTESGATPRIREQQREEKNASASNRSTDTPVNGATDSTIGLSTPASAPASTHASTNAANTEPTSLSASIPSLVGQSVDSLDRDATQTVVWKLYKPAAKNSDGLDVPQQGTTNPTLGIPRLIVRRVADQEAPVVAKRKFPFSRDEGDGIKFADAKMPSKIAKMSSPIALGSLKLAHRLLRRQVERSPSDQQFNARIEEKSVSHPAGNPTLGSNYKTQAQAQAKEKVQVQGQARAQATTNKSKNAQMNAWIQARFSAQAMLVGRILRSDNREPLPLIQRSILSKSAKTGKSADSITQSSSSYQVFARLAETSQNRGTDSY